MVLWAIVSRPSGVRSWDGAVRIGLGIPTGRWNGAGDRIRTGDIDLGKVALYQLSYSRACGGKDPKGQNSLSRPLQGKSNRTGSR